MRPRRRGSGAPRVGVALLLWAAAACSSPSAVERLVPEVIRTLPHDSLAYTQGLLFHQGRLYESTGRYGESTLREVDPETGEVLRTVALDSAYFGEGLARVGDELVQLTWQENTAFRWDLATFDSLGTHAYETHGWGLCHDRGVLRMTTGGSIMVERDLETFERLGSVTVMNQGSLARRLNELECVDGFVYANVYQSDQILKIDPARGEVVAEIDASDLVPPELRGDPDAVLNGIAWDPGSGAFYLTGKLWPVTYQVRFVAAG